MENEVSGIAKLGIVLIALAVLIGLGFGIFQISKGTANTGVNNVQEQLDGVSNSQFTTYDQTTITGTMARSAITDFEGKNTAVLIATQAWVNLTNDAPMTVGDAQTTAPEKGSGISAAYSLDGAKGTQIPVVWAYTEKEFTTPYTMQASSGDTVNGSFVNYNALLGSPVASIGTTPADSGCTAQTCKIDGSEYNMAGIYFDSNCFRCTSGFMANNSGRVQFNNIISNIQKTGTTEFLPTGGKFTSFLIKDASGTNMGIALQQIGNN